MNRRAVILAGLATLPAAAVPWTASAQRRRTARRRQGGLTASHVPTRIVTRTFTSTVPIAIPLNSPVGIPYPSTIKVSGLTRGQILKVRVALIGLTHTFPNNLDIMVVGPGNVGVILMSDTGSGTDIAGITLTFDQDAAARLPDPLTSGTFQPLNNPPDLDNFPAPAPQGVTGHSLTRFTNRNPNGRWRLFIQDDFPPADGGSLAGWALRLRVRVRVPHQHGPSRSRRPTRRAKR